RVGRAPPSGRARADRRGAGGARSGRGGREGAGGRGRFRPAPRAAAFGPVEGAADPRLLNWSQAGSRMARGEPHGVRILGWDTVDGTTVPLHARLTVLPGLADDERALLLGRLAATADAPADELVLRAADLPGAIAPPDLPALDDALHRAQQRHAEDALFAAASADAAELVRLRE